MAAKINNSSYVTQNNGTSLEPKRESYFVSTQDLSRIDDVLKVCLGVMTFRLDAESTLLGAVVGSNIPPLRSAPVHIINEVLKGNEERIRAEKIVSIGNSMIFGAIVQLAEYNGFKLLLANFFAGIYGIQAIQSLARDNSEPKIIDSHIPK